MLLATAATALFNRKRCAAQSASNNWKPQNGVMPKNNPMPTEAAIVPGSCALSVKNSWMMCQNLSFRPYDQSTRNDRGTNHDCNTSKMFRLVMCTKSRTGRKCDAPVFSVSYVHFTVTGTTAVPTQAARTMNSSSYA